MIFRAIALWAVLIAYLNCTHPFCTSEQPIYSNFVSDDIFKEEIYLKITDDNEILIASAAHGIFTDVQRNDFVTHVNGVKIITGGLTAFLLGESAEACVPIIDDEDVVDGGSRLLGFLKIQTFSNLEKVRTSITLRRGEFKYSDTETTLGASPVPLPEHGGGQCITSKDCSLGNGTCIQEICHCVGLRTGLHCQIRHSAEEGTFLNTLRKEEAIKNEEQRELYQQKIPEPSKHFDNNSFKSGRRKNQENDSKRDSPHRPSDVKVDLSATQNPELKVEAKVENRRKIKGKKKIKPKLGSALKSNPVNTASIVDSIPPTASYSNREMREGPQHDLREHGAAGVDVVVIADENTGIDDRRQTVIQRVKPVIVQDRLNNSSDDGVAVEKGLGAGSMGGRLDSVAAAGAAGNSHFESVIINDIDQVVVDAEASLSSETERTVESLYGAGKQYPEPYLAGKPPNELVHLRQKSKREEQPFRYAVRFRVGPMGLSFNNKVPNATVVERIVPRMQSEMSDIQVGDVVVAVDQFDTTDAPARVTQRIISSLSWPLIVVFETRPVPNKANEAQISMKKRIYNLNIIYPPSLVSSSPVPVLLAVWTPNINTTLTKQSDGTNDGESQLSSGSNGTPHTVYNSAGASTSTPTLIPKGQAQSCPLYLVRTAQDLFGCEVSDGEFSVPSPFTNTGPLDPSMALSHPMLSLILAETSPNMHIAVRSLALMKRGVCTFVDKARGVSQGLAEVGVVVNSDDSLLDMPAGKEETRDLPSLGIVKESDGFLLHQAAMQGEVLAVISDPDSGPTFCSSIVSAAADILNRWPHSVPAVPISSVLSSAPNLLARPLSQQGGRIAVSGGNGWAFFDYHLALFGSSDLPLGTHRLQMAHPPSGCDPSSYTVRVKGTVVAILRGGGCSFGIKVLNAQKLGAIAVIIVNSPDSKGMRIMAAADEVPLIYIPCIMASSRMVLYLESRLVKYHLTNQHLVSFEPTGLFGEYESRSAAFEDMP